MKPDGIPTPARLMGLTACLAAFVVAVGCGKEAIRVYSVPKESVQPALSPAQWDLPAGWTEQPAGGMRVGSFLVKGEDGKTADVSIIPLSATSGSNLDNVNRWRGQLGLESVTESGYAETVKTISIDEQEAAFVDLSGTDSRTSQPTRILGAISRMPDQTWFFKMTGPEELVAAQKPAFTQFLESFSFPGESGESPALSASEDLPSTSPQAASPSTGLPSWEIPSSWKSQPATSMLLARFGLSGAEPGDAEITVSSFPGDVGGLLANVNRWRSQQLGLPPIRSDSVGSVTTPVTVSNIPATLVDMTNPDASKRILVALVPHQGKTWFFKLLGNAELVARERPGFMSYLESIQFPNAP